jgi:hypothetical protein
MLTLRDIYLVKKQKSLPRPSKKNSKKSFFGAVLVLALIILFLANFFFASKMTADYVAENVSPISFFKDGKFLILFQNNSELRSSGGFIGSFAVLSMKDFEVQSLDFNTNIYTLNSAFTKTHYVKAPAPLENFIRGKSWALRDSNYDVSFPEACSDINNFYEQETGKTVDGIVAINASIMVDLLKLTGPIPMEKYNTVISADNFFLETQTQIEKTYYEDPENWTQNEPKTIIKDLYPKIISKALKENKVDLTKLLISELETKNIQLYFKDVASESWARKRGWGGQVYNGVELLDKFNGQMPDYLYVVDNNYSGNKSSLSVSEQIDYQVDSLGAAELSVSRIHHGTETWPDGINTSYLRILTPKGSILKEATLNGINVTGSIDTTLEADKTTFGITVKVGPGQASILKLKYQEPQKYNPYGLVVQKQSGVADENLRVINGGKVLFDGALERDLFLKR